MSHSVLADRSYHIKGGSVGVLLLHGLSGTPMELRTVALALGHAGCTVSVPQLAGHCGSIDDLKNTTHRDWERSANDALTKLRQSCDVVIVGGLSMGAVLSLKLAAERPQDVDAVAALAPTINLDGWAVPWYAHLFSLVKQNWCADLITFHEIEPYGIKDRRLREFVLKALLGPDSATAGLPGCPGRSMLEFRHLVRGAKARLNQIEQPTLVIHPREDDRASLSNAELLQRKLAGDVQVVVLDDSYHVITLDRQRDVVAGRVVAFAERIAGSHGVALRDVQRAAQPDGESQIAAAG